MSRDRERQLKRGHTVVVLAGLSLSACVEPEPEPDAPDVPPDVAYCDSVRDWDPVLAEREQEVLALLNEHRTAGARCGTTDFEPVEALIMDPALRCAARIHALDMGAQDYFANLDPDGLSFADRALLAEYDGEAVQQIIGARQASAAQAIEAIMGNTSLCSSAMSPEVSEVGIGHGPETDATYERYWAQVFGRR